MLSSALRRGLDEGERLLRSAAADLFSDESIAAGANAIIPGSGTVLEGVGIIGDCDWLCQLKKWISESGFFQRLALAFLAFIILAAAFYLMKGNLISQVTSRMKGAMT